MLIFNPRQTVLITCKGVVTILGKPTEKDDVVPLHWHSPAASHPPHYAIFLQKGILAVQIIRESKAFVVNFVPFSLVPKIQQSMKLAGDHLHKCEILGLQEITCEKLVDCFRLKDALGWLECEVAEEKEMGDHIVFLGKVLFSELLRQDDRPFHIEGDKFTTTR